MKKKKVAIAILASGILLTGCTNTDKKYTEKGAGIVFFGGALAGAAADTKNPLRGALIGALAGAAIGGGIGQYMDKQYNDLVAIQKEHSNLLGEIQYVNKGTPEQNIIVPVKTDELFVGNTTDMKPEYQAVLNDVTATINSNNESKYSVQCYTDNNGDKEAAIIKTQQRADSIKNYIEKQGIAGEKIDSKGYGQARPVADNETEAGRKENRRVEIVIAADKANS